MEDTLKYQATWDRRLQFGWKLGSVALLLILFLVGRMLFSKKTAAVQLVVFAFSAEEEVFTQGIFPAFEQAWEIEKDEELTIEGVFGPSGVLAGQIILGAPADIAVLSNINQVNWLQLGEALKPDAQPVVIGLSPIVIVTRPGNPYHLKELADLSMPGLNLLHANPRSSGVAEWALLAEYGDALQATGNPRVAEEQLLAIWQNVHVLAPSARELLALFDFGVGDALLTYEQDARLALARGVQLEMIMPSRTIIAQPVAVVIDGNVKRSEQAAVHDFMNFLISEQGQEIFRQFHLRSTGRSQEGFSVIEQPFTVEDLGGWSQIFTNQVKPFWESQVEANLVLESLTFNYIQGR